MTKTIEKATDMTRYAELRRMLEGRRCMAREDVQAKIRTVRDRVASGGELHEGFDEIEIAEVDIQDDIDVALIQMKNELLQQIDESLERLHGGDYGYCADCGREISEKRLRALPFAVRCTPCEVSREATQASRPGALPRPDHRAGIQTVPQTL